jgi:hypothetical protein
MVYFPQRAGHEAEGAFVDLGHSAFVDAVAEADLAYCEAAPVVQRDSNFLVPSCLCG